MYNYNNNVIIVFIQYVLYIATRCLYTVQSIVKCTLLIYLWLFVTATIVYLAVKTAFSGSSLNKWFIIYCVQQCGEKVVTNLLLYSESYIFY